MPESLDHYNECPPEKIWDEVVTGLRAPEEALALTEHASRCDFCAQSLRSSIEILGSAEVSAAAEPLVKGTAAVPIPIHRTEQRVASLPRHFWAVAAGLIIAVGSGYWLWSIREADPVSLMARVYSAHRTTELRLPGAAWGPVRVERTGTAGSIADQPRDVLDAATRIQNGLSRDSQDPQWLRAKGRLAIVEGRFLEAIQSLTAAADAGTSSPDLLTDLAVAYAGKGHAEDSSTDLMHAVDLLGRVLKDKGDLPAALFNRALIEEELHEVPPAIADLEKLLSIESSSQWSNEARSRLDRLRKQRAAFYERRPGEDASRFDEIGLDDALAAGLTGSRDALSRLAVRLRDEHQDYWLEDLLSAKGSGTKASAMATLGRMAVIRISVESGRYLSEKNAFDAVRNVAQPEPMLAWEQMEALYRATRARAQFPCSGAAGDIHEIWRARGYHWVVAQILLERATCLLQSGDLDASEAAAVNALHTASSHGFPVAAARVNGLLVNIARRRGLYRKAIDLSNSSLAAILNDGLPVARSHEFYNVMMGVADDLRWPHAAFAAANAMTEAARAAHFRDLEFTNIVRSAQLALECGDQTDSERLFGQALRFYGTLAPSQNRAWAEIGFAEATGDESRLASYAAELEDSRDPVIWIPYQRLRSALALKHGRPAEALERLGRISDWMRRPVLSTTDRSNQWHFEFYSTLNIYLKLLLQQDRSDEAFARMQEWRALEERRLASSHERRVPVDRAVVFSLMEVDGRIAAWRADGDALNFRWASIDRVQLDRMTRQFRRLMTSPTANLLMIEKVGGQLADALFGGWLKSVAEGRPMVIQTDGTMGNLPFQVLPGRSEPLGIEHPLSVTTLALARSAAGSHSGSRANRMLVVDASDVPAGWAHELPPITGIEREIASVQTSVPAAVVIRGHEATARTIAKLSPGMRAMHFIGHGVRTSDGISLLIAGNTTPVGLDNLAILGFQAPETVVLAACSTGETNNAENFGPDSMAAAFLFAGSAEAIASLWNVDSESTADLMAEFYRQLAEGHDSSRALQAAMRAVRNSAQYRHPYFWGAFTRFIRG